MTSHRQVRFDESWIERDLDWSITIDAAEIRIYSLLVFHVTSRIAVSYDTSCTSKQHVHTYVDSRITRVPLLSFQTSARKSLKLVRISSPTPRLSSAKSASRAYMNSRLEHARRCCPFSLPHASCRLFLLRLRLFLLLLLVPRCGSSAFPSRHISLSFSHLRSMSLTLRFASMLVLCLHYADARAHIYHPFFHPFIPSLLDIYFSLALSSFSIFLPIIYPIPWSTSRSCTYLFAADALFCHLCFPFSIGSLIFVFWHV